MLRSGLKTFSFLARHLRTAPVRCSSAARPPLHQQVFEERDGILDNAIALPSSDGSAGEDVIKFTQTGGGAHSLLLLPGALGCAKTDFLPILQQINKFRFTAYAIDPPGYGRSVPPQRAWDMDFYHRDARAGFALMKEMCRWRHATFSIMGWSDGGIAALIMAATQPTRVRKLVVWGANAFVSNDDIAIYEGIRDISKWSDRMRQPYLDMYGEVYFRENWEAWVDTLKQIHSDRDGNICRELLEKIECPTLIIHGDKDKMLPLSHAEYLHTNIKNSQMMRFPEGNHNLHLRHTVDFLTPVERFLGF